MLIKISPAFRRMRNKSLNPRTHPSKDIFPRRALKNIRLMITAIMTMKFVERQNNNILALFIHQ